jgi:aspartate/methionine/tyrosine aminotransferase
MSWAKHYAAARYNLANSGLLGCQTDDLPLTIDDVPINGPNHEGYAPLHEAIAAHYGVGPGMVMTAQGTAMANFLALATVIERGDEVLVEQPTYEPILAAASYLGAEIKRFGRHFADGYQADLDEVRRLVTPRTRLIVVTSPHNPSGVVLNQESLIEIGEIANTVGALVLVDEVYRDILFEDAPVTAARLGSQFIATASLTKSYGLSGLRCGWILSEPALAERMRRLNDIFGAVGALPSEALAVKAFAHLDLLARRTRGIIEPNIKQTHEFLERHSDLLDCVVPPRSMIVFPRLKFAADSEPLHDALREYETSIVPGKYFESPAHFRLGFAVSPEDVAVGLENVSRVLRAPED